MHKHSQLDVCISAVVGEVRISWFACGNLCHVTSAYLSHTISISLPVSLSLCLSSHLHIHSDPQLFVYFWDCLIRGQMCRLCLAAAEACGLREQQSDRGKGF